MKKIVLIEIICIIIITAFLFEKGNQQTTNLTNLLALIDVELIYLLYIEIRKNNKRSIKGK
jgi:hypothetical protein